MPLTLGPISRRKFLSAAVVGAAGLALPRSLWAFTGQPDPNYFILISDTHLHEDRKFVHKNAFAETNMWNNFQQVCREALALQQRPVAVLINGDIAFRTGLVEDYATAMLAMDPFRQEGLTVHLALGNHDDRKHIAAVAEKDETLAGEAAPRRVMLLATPRANIIMLDSLDATDSTPGRLGSDQLAWLTMTLDKHPDRPALVFVHHQPYLQKTNMGDGTHLDDYVRSEKSVEAAAADPTPMSLTNPKPHNDALLDTLPLLNVLLPRKQVKAYFFGHTHEYSHKTIEGMHLVNLPSTAWIFAGGQPLGWMDMHVEDNGAKLQLHCLDPKHSLQNDKLDLRWRA